jgi:cobalamin synthase/adenosyl cobinamide kinase/adenosyl cobinamide phosphate guanylyltransferase
VITLVLGGVRSGKSEVAERLAGPGPGTYLATGLVAPGDDDFAGRVARHQARRPPSWVTVEEPRAVPGLLARLHGAVLLDALGTWIANEPRADIDGLVEALVTRRGDTVVVSEEVGLGVHPVTEIGRLFADRLGEANRRIAEAADRCILVVAGRVIDLPPGGLAATAPASGEAAFPAESGPPPQPVALDPHSRPWTHPRRNRSHAMEDLAGEAAPPAPTTLAGGFRQAVSFLTPVGGAASPTPAALMWFPLVGALLGLVLGGLWWAAVEGLGLPAAAALVVAADLALTGALHFDGLLDSADGLLPHLRREKRLAVMADPHVGAFAVATGTSALLLRAAALAAMGTAHPWLLAGLWTVSRTSMAVTALTGRYARAHGLASSFLGAPTNQTTAQWAVPAGVGAVLALGLAAADDPGSVVAVVAATSGAAAVALLAQRRIGGFTGDTLGAGGVVAETIGLLTAAAVLRP